MTAEDIYDASKAGEPVLWSARQVDACLDAHDLDTGMLSLIELGCLLAAVDIAGRIDAWEVLAFLGY